MLLSSASQPSLARHARSRSLGSISDHETETPSSPLRSASPTLLSVSPTLRSESPTLLSRKLPFHETTFHRTVHLQPLAQVQENRAGIQQEEVEEAKKQVQEEFTWNLKEIWDWYNCLPWVVGMNYMPRTAVNFVEMWDESSFSPEIIDEELKWAAEKLGYNTLRTNIPMVLYELDAEGLTRRVNKFLRIAARNGFVVMLCPLDDCEFGGEPAKPGPQPEPVPGLHNSRAVGSPGRHIVMDPSQWFRVEEYIRYVVRTWGHDQRILLLDLYNEPGNPWIFRKEGTSIVPEVEKYEENSYLLMEKVFEWAREEKPSKPLTVAAWHMPDPFMDSSVVPLAHRIDQRAMELSDVISVHAYCDPMCLRTTLGEIASFGKPILLTEWMARQVKSTYDETLPTLKELKVGAYQWGLVKGKAQTYLPWPHVAHKYEGDPMWWHDVLDADGTFHNEVEGDLIRSFAYPQQKAFSSDALLIEPDSSENLASIASSLDLKEHLLEVPNIPEGEEAVIPSVCSISMATVNAMAMVAAAEQTVREESFGDGHGHGHESLTFGAHMKSPSMEGLDLVFGGLEF